ncbi:hypothetical protein BJX61DRAFT_533627 [Aspergillus egyptiacus]|nr:hypothetical protein BJX61DRAFT_533627 [Aspergillus egyptiacus]
MVVFWFHRLHLTLKIRFLITIIASFVSLQLLSLGNLSYLYGTQFRSSERIHNLNVLYVDYDGGVIGRSVMDAYRLLGGNSFPSIQPSLPEEYPTPMDVKEAVCDGDYWGAVYAVPGASDDLAAALVNGQRAPDTLGYVWNGARYPAFAQSAVYANIIALIQATRSMYYANNASSVVKLDDLEFPVLLDPIHATEINIKPTMQGSRVLYNTASIVLPVIMQFFFAMALNAISEEFKIFTTFSWVSNVLIRLSASITFTLVGSLCMTGYIWGFKESWNVNANQFVLSWIILWLFMHINSLVFDTLSAFVPIKFMPFCVLTWAIMNISSTVSPLELSPAFYRLGYALPAYEAYQVLGQIWSDGCNNQLHRALPILFAWWVVGIVTAIYGIFYRCEKARSAEQRRPTHEHERPTTQTGSTDQILPRGTLESIRLERRYMALVILLCLKTIMNDRRPGLVR